MVSRIIWYASFLCNSDICDLSLSLVSWRSPSERKRKFFNSITPYFRTIKLIINISSENKIATINVVRRVASKISVKKWDERYKRGKMKHLTKARSEKVLVKMKKKSKKSKSTCRGSRWANGGKNPRNWVTWKGAMKSCSLSSGDKLVATYYLRTHNRREICWL